jgi:tetratricopeptide (TPR) repeat protein
LPDKSCTTFSWAFFDALTSGKVDGHAYISLRDVHRLIEDRLRNLHSSGVSAPYPIIHAPDQGGRDDISFLPFFPNPAFKLQVPSKHVGKSFRELSTWLAKTWLEGDRPVCCIDGFPGVGKTELAYVLMNITDRVSVLVDMPDAGVSQERDFLDRLSTSLSLAGQDDMARILNSDSNLSVSSVLVRLLRSNILIIIDKFQCGLFDQADKPISTFTRFIETVTRTVRLPGRLLLLSNRTIDSRSLWTERVEIRTLLAPETSAAEQLLDGLLHEKNIDQKVPPERKRDVVEWLGCNPRALRVLATALRDDVLDDLIGLRPELWEWWQDRPVSPELLKDLEQALLVRSLSHLKDTTRSLLRRLAVYRIPVKKEAIEIQLATGEELLPTRKVLLDLFLMKHRNGWFSLHPIVREVSLKNLEMQPVEFKQAHRKAAAHYLRHFKAKNIVNTEQLKGYFVEARYHLARSDHEEDLLPFAERFISHLQTIFKPVSPLPKMSDELDEIITILSVLLHSPGPTGLEYYLARLYRARGTLNDLVEAIVHARRATNARTPEAWLLLSRLQEQMYGIEQALQVCQQGIASISDRYPVTLYQRSGELLAQANRTEEAISLLKEGIERIPAEKNLVALYQSCGELLAQANRTEEAISLLKEGIERIPAEKGLVALYGSCSEILAQTNRMEEAIILLKEGIERIPAEKGLFALYQRSGELLAQANRMEEAIILLKEGIERIPVEKGLVALYESCGELLAQANRTEEAIILLKEGIERIPVEKGLVALYESCSELLAQTNRMEEAIILLKEGIERIPVEKDLVALYESCSELLAQTNRMEEAIILLKEGIERIPVEKVIGALYQICGKIFVCLGKTAEAIAIFKEGLSKIPFGKYDRYRVAEAALYLCLAAQDVPALEGLLSVTGTAALEHSQVILGQALRLNIQCEWKQAAEKARQALIELPMYSALVVLEAFSWLCVGENQTAYKVLQHYPLRLEKRHPNAWLQALVAFKASDQKMARKSLSCYLGQTVDDNEVITMNLLLSHWNTRPTFLKETDLALYFPVLPPSVTDFPHELKRIAYGPPISF